MIAIGAVTVGFYRFCSFVFLDKRGRELFKFNVIIIVFLWARSIICDLTLASHKSVYQAIQCSAYELCIYCVNSFEVCKCTNHLWYKQTRLQLYLYQGDADSVKSAILFFVLLSLAVPLPVFGLAIFSRRSVFSCNRLDLLKAVKSHGSGIISRYWVDFVVFIKLTSLRPLDYYPTKLINNYEFV